MPNIQFLNPESVGKPLAAYSNIARVRSGEFLFIAGQVGMDKDGKAAADFETQCAQVFANIGAALASQGANFANIVSFTSYLVHAQDIPKFAQYRARDFPRLCVSLSLNLFRMGFSIARLPPTLSSPSPSCRRPGPVSPR